VLTVVSFAGDSICQLNGSQKDSRFATFYLVDSQFTSIFSRGDKRVNLKTWDLHSKRSRVLLLQHTCHDILY